MTDPAPETKSPDGVRKAECARCGGLRNCDIRGDHEESYGDENVQAWRSWYILKCRGCDHAFVQTVSTHSQDYDWDDSENIVLNETVRYWPALSKRKKPRWMSKFGIEAVSADALRLAMVELYGALDNDLHMLAAIGVRTTYDIASELLGIDPNLTFAQKLEELVRSNRIGPLDRDRLETVVDAGSAAAHRGWRPSPRDLDTIMDVLEHFIEESFVKPARQQKLDAAAAKVKRTVPPRPARAKTKRAPRKPKN